MCFTCTGHSHTAETEVFFLMTAIPKRQLQTKIGVPQGVVGLGSPWPMHFVSSIPILCFHFLPALSPPLISYSFTSLDQPAALLHSLHFFLSMGSRGTSPRDFFWKRPICGVSFGAFWHIKPTTEFSISCELFYFRYSNKLTTNVS